MRSASKVDVRVAYSGSCEPEDRTPLAPGRDPTNDHRIDELIADYLERLDRHEPSNHRQILQEYPDLAAELAEFFAADRWLSAIFARGDRRDMSL